MLELIQGESGVHPADEEYIKNVRKLCDDSGILLIIDEVQTGVGRTGTFFCYEQYGIKPDIVTLAKGLGGGVPIGAMLCTDEVATGFKPGDHGTTFGGNPLACTAGNTVLDVLDEDRILDNVNEVSSILFEKLTKLSGKYSAIKSVRGKGLLIGIEFDERISASNMRLELAGKHILVSSIGNSVIRIAPPLIITKSQANAFCKAIDGILKNTVPAKKNVIDIIKDKIPAKGETK